MMSFLIKTVAEFQEDYFMKFIIIQVVLQPNNEW